MPIVGHFVSASKKKKLYDFLPDAQLEDRTLIKHRIHHYETIDLFRRLITTTSLIALTILGVSFGYLSMPLAIIAASLITIVSLLTNQAFYQVYLFKISRPLPPPPDIDPDGIM